MKIRLTTLLFTLIALIVFLLFLVVPPSPPSKPMHTTVEEKVPDFGQYRDIKQKKQAFFDFMYPKVEQAIIEIMQDRAWIQSHKYQPNNPKWQKLVQDYRVKTEQHTPAEIKQALLKRVDLIPPSMALAQAANESAWGTSRFAKQAKNFYGQWCFTKGCGIEPKLMNPKHYHAVHKFNTVLGSVRSYMRNINRHPSYKLVREIRWHLRQKKQFPYGIYLVDGLVNYSQHKEVYIKELKAMIRYNRLQKYDEKLKQTLKILKLPQS